MADFINTSDVIGDDALVDSIIEGTITEYKSDKTTKIGPDGLSKCAVLKTVDVPNVTIIEVYAFRDCSALTALILRGSTVCNLRGTGAFSGTPIASGTGYIYIPAALKDSYAAATNWATYAAQFRALEDYTVDGTVDGELDETKI